jgi:hypothetical protein
LKYFDHLRSQHRRSPRAEADAELAKAKAHWLQLRVLEKQKALMPVAEHYGTIAQMAGTVLTVLGGWPARIAGRDITLRRRAEQLLRELRLDIANACNEQARMEGAEAAKREREAAAAAPGAPVGAAGEVADAPNAALGEEKEE